MLQGHGDNAYLFKGKITANFSSNVYFKGPSKELIKHLTGKLNIIGNYPEVAAESLNKRIAGLYELTPENILVTNGATEAFYLLALLFKNSSSDIFTPSFSEYSDACSLHNHKIKYISNEQLNSKYLSTSGQVWICNPNNPDGKLLSSSELEKLLLLNKKSFMIIDEAYIDFCKENASLINKINLYPNLIIVRSLTKKYAIPGLRLGYIAASKAIISKLLKLKEPWSVNALAIEAGKFLLNQANTLFDLEELLALSQRIQHKLAVIKGIEVIPSQTSFFLIKLKKSAHQTTEYLANIHGILVRNASNFRGLDDSYIRISTQSETDNYKLIIALGKWIQQ